MRYDISNFTVIILRTNEQELRTRNNRRERLYLSCLGSSFGPLNKVCYFKKIKKQIHNNTKGFD